MCGGPRLSIVTTATMPSLCDIGAAPSSASTTRVTSCNRIPPSPSFSYIAVVLTLLGTTGVFARGSYFPHPSHLTLTITRLVSFP